MKHNVHTTIQMFSLMLTKAVYLVIWDIFSYVLKKIKK